MQLTRGFAALLACLTLVAPLCLAAGQIKENADETPQLPAVELPQLGQLDAQLDQLDQLRESLDRLKAAGDSTPRLKLQFDDLTARLERLQRPAMRFSEDATKRVTRQLDDLEAQLRHLKIDVGNQLSLASESTGPGIASWADPSIDPGISLWQPESPEQFRKRAEESGWPRREINGLTFYIMPLVEAPRRRRRRSSECRRRNEHDVPPLALDRRCPMRSMGLLVVLLAGLALGSTSMHRVRPGGGKPRQSSRAGRYKKTPQRQPGLSSLRP